MARGKSWLLVLGATIVVALLIAACAPAASPPAAKSEPKAETKTETKAVPKAEATAQPKAETKSQAKAEPTAAAKAESKPAAAKPKELVKLKIAHPHKGLPEISNAPIADLKGFFKEEGLDVEFYWTKGGGDTVRAVVTGGADIGMDTGPMSLLGANEEGANLKIIGAGVTGPNFVWMVPKDSPAKTIKDLEGKKIGFSSQGSSTHMVLQIISEQSGVKVEPVASGSTPDSWTAAKTHQIDAAWATPPDTYKLEEEGARGVFSSRDYPMLNDYTYIVNFARTDVIKGKANEFLAFNRALNKAADFIASDPEGAAKIYLQNTNLTVELLARYFKSIKPKDMWNLSTIKGWDITSKYAKIFNFAKKDVDLKDVLDLSTVPK